MKPYSDLMRDVIPYSDEELEGIHKEAAQWTRFGPESVVRLAAQLLATREALWRARHSREPEPCWCLDPPEEEGEEHEKDCLAARAVLPEKKP